MRLLLVEDDTALNRKLKVALTQAGFAVDVVENGVDAEWVGDVEPYDVEGKRAVSITTPWPSSPPVPGSVCNVGSSAEPRGVPG